MKTATSLTLVAAGAIIAFAITAHVAFLNLQVTGAVIILTGIAGAIITRSSWLPRTPAGKGRPGAAAAGGTGQHPPPSRRPAPGAQPPAAPGATPAKPETTKERDHQGIRRRLTRARTYRPGHQRTGGPMTRPEHYAKASTCRPLPTSTAAAPLTAMTRSLYRFKMPQANLTCGFME